MEFQISFNFLLLYPSKTESLLQAYNESETLYISNDCILWKDLIFDDKVLLSIQECRWSRVLGYQQCVYGRVYKLGRALSDQRERHGQDLPPGGASQNGVRKSDIVNLHPN